MKIFYSKFNADLVVWFRYFILILCFAPIPQSLANTSQNPTFFAKGQVGNTTTKSKLFANNDTSFSLKYTVGVHAGNENNLGILFRSESNTTVFELNDNKATTSHQDTIVRYYLGPFYLGGIINQFQLLASTPENSEYLDALALGFGANMGLNLYLVRGGAVFLDANYVTTNTVKEVNQADLKIGARMDAKIGGSIPLTRQTVRALIGHSYRSYTYTLDGTSYPETVYSTWFGIGLNYFF